MTLIAGTPVTNISVNALSSTCCLLHFGFFLGLLLEAKFLRNVGWLSQDYKHLYKNYSSVIYYV
jgi:hypothetical protein